YSTTLYVAWVFSLQLNKLNSLLSETATLLQQTDQHTPVLANMSEKQTLLQQTDQHTPVLANMSASLAELNLVLVGMSGVGKSAAGNTILGSDEFRSEASPSSLTLTSQRGEGEVCGRRVTVVDTPGLCNTELSGEKLREEMQKAVTLCDGKPHAVLLVIQLGRFTEQEKRVMETLQELFSNSVNEYTMVLFTYGDRLRKKTIEEFIHSDTNLQQLLRKCGDRYHVFNNECGTNSDQLTQFLLSASVQLEPCMAYGTLRGRGLAQCICVWMSRKSRLKQPADLGLEAQASTIHSARVCPATFDPAAVWVLDIRFSSGNGLKNVN
ncbi:hypothetical protein SKAU_G00042880, partial [Synaphobranchus kaupii]